MKTINKIPFLELKSCQTPYQLELEEALLSVVRRGWYLLGEELQAFEEELSEYLGGGWVVGCANGLDALRLIFRGYCELGRLRVGDRVIVPAGTYIATVLALTDCGLVPVFVDTDPRTMNMDLQKVEQALDDRTRAILPVHLYGRVCWSLDLERLADKKGLLIVEDNAQAIGASFEGRKSGVLGDASGFSFYPSKNLGAMGDGGAVVTRDEELARVVRSLGNYGSSKKYVFDYQGLNSRLDEIQAAVLRVKLRYLDSENEYRRCLAKRYAEGIIHPELFLPEIPLETSSHVWHLYPVRSCRRDLLQSYLNEKGIGTQIHYPIPPYLQSCYREWNSLSFPEAERLAAEELSLPLSVGHSEADIDEVIRWVNLFPRL